MSAIHAIFHMMQQGRDVVVVSWLYQLPCNLIYITNTPSIGWPSRTFTVIEGDVHLMGCIDNDADVVGGHACSPSFSNRWKLHFSDNAQVSTAR